MRKQTIPLTAEAVTILRRGIKAQTPQRTTPNGQAAAPAASSRQTNGHPEPAPRAIGKQKTQPAAGTSDATAKPTGSTDETPKKAPKAPKVTTTIRFSLTPSGVFAINEETKARIWVCSWLRIDAYTCDIDGECWGRLLVWKDRNGREHRRAIPMDLFAGEAVAVREILLSGGLDIGYTRGARDLLTQYIQSQHPTRSCVCVPHIGWHEHIYVFPDTVIPEGATASVIYQTRERVEHFYKSAGTLEEWQNRIGRPCVGNSRLVFGTSTAFAAPLQRPMNVEGGGFNLVGLSSTGKSTVQQVAGSACGGGNGSHGFSRSWRFTANAGEGMAEMHNDGLLILDEMREMPDPKELDAVVYMLANGVGKSRSTKANTAQRTRTWLTLFLSSGEVALSEHAESAGARVKGGAEVRLLNIPADAGAGMGVFEKIPEPKTAREFAEQLKTATGECYGTALRAFLRRFVENWDANCEEVQVLMDDFMRDSLVPAAAPEVGRALRRVALVAAAGEMATRWEITGWEPGEASRAASQCAKDWIDARGGIGQTDIEAGLRQVRTFIAVKGPSCFQSVVQQLDRQGNELRERMNERAGFWKEEDGRRLYLIFPDVFKTQVCRGLNSKLILRELLKRGFLVKGDGRNLAKHVPIPNEGQIRLYAITARILEGEEKDVESLPGDD